MAHLVAPAQGDGEILPALLGGQPFVLQGQRFQIPQQRSQRRAQIVGNIGHKFAALAVAVCQPIPLTGYLPGKVNKAVLKNRYLITGLWLRRAGRRGFDGADAVPIVRRHGR